MPFAIADIGALLFAFLCLALAYSIVTFGKFIAALIPSVPVIGGAIRNAILSATESAGGFLMDLTHASWNRSVQMLNAMVYITNWLPTKVINVFEHHAAQLSTIQHTSIPTAVNTEASNRINDVNNEASQRAAAVSGVESELHKAETSLQNNIDTLEHQTVPADIQNAKDDISRTLNVAEANLQHNIDALSSTLVSDLSNVWNAIEPLQHAVAETLPAELAAEAAAANQAIAQAKADILSKLTDTITTVEGEIQTARETAATALEGAVQGIDADLNNAIVAEQNALIAAKNDVLIQLQTSTKQLQGSIDIDNANIGSLQRATELTIPAAIAGVAAGVAAITSEFARCAVTSCDGPNSLSNVWKTLRQDAGLLSEIGFVAAAIKDPQGTEEALSGVLGGLFNQGHNLLDDLLAL